MNTKAIRQLADVTLDKYRSSIPRKAFEEFVKDIITGENRATAFRYEASPICRASFPSTLDEDDARCTSGTPTPPSTRLTTSSPSCTSPDWREAEPHDSKVRRLRARLERQHLPEDPPHRLHLPAL